MFHAGGLFRAEVAYQPDQAVLVGAVQHLQPELRPIQVEAAIRLEVELSALVGQVGQARALHHLAILVADDDADQLVSH